MTDWRSRARRLAADLSARGDIVDPVWEVAFANVPRHHFVRRFFDGDEEISERDGRRWLNAVYRDDALLIARRSAAGSRSLPTSSSSQPAIMAVMLDRLRISEGHRVLEIGTGTGYNAALLCFRLGDGAVTTIDLDPALTATATERLAELGFHPRVATADGEHGYPPNAPYDRIIATCAIGHVPRAWARQLSSGGRVVAPFGGAAGGLVVLDKVGPDELVGRFDPTPACFMPLRPRVDDPFGPDETASYTGGGETRHSTTALDPARLTTAGPDLRLWLQLHIPGLTLAQSGRRHLSLHTRDGMAQVGLASKNGSWPVEQRGQRSIWSRVEEALGQWDRLGHPHRERLGISIWSHGQAVWLDEPGGAYSWVLPD